jgi:hypothetical protein
MHAVRTLKILGPALTVGGMMFLPAVAHGLSCRWQPCPRAEGEPAFGHALVIIGGEHRPHPGQQDRHALLRRHRQAGRGLAHQLLRRHSVLRGQLRRHDLGQFTARQQRDGAPAACHQDVPNLFGQFDAASLSCKVRAEPRSARCFLPNSRSDDTLNPYAPRTVVRYNLIVANLCEDAHDSSNQPLATNHAVRPVPPARGVADRGLTGLRRLRAAHHHLDEGILTSINHAGKFGSGGRMAFAVASRWPCPGPGAAPTSEAACTPSSPGSSPAAP